MGNQKVTQAVVDPQAAYASHQTIEKFALFNPDGSRYTGSDQSFEPLTTATAIGTAAKVVTDAEPAANSIVVLKFTSGNSAAAVTVAFAGGAARAVYLGGAAVSAGEAAVAALGVTVYWFDGTILHQLGAMSNA